MTKTKCKDCCFWAQTTRTMGSDPKRQLGTCRLRAPSVIELTHSEAVKTHDPLGYLEVIYANTHWPVTTENQWCGEHKTKQENAE